MRRHESPLMTSHVMTFPACYNFLMSSRSAFTLVELLVVIAIVAVLAVVVVLVLNPAQLLMQARDSNRLSDLATINSALGYLRTDQPSASLGNASTSYISVLDPSATSTAGDQCQGLVMPSLGSSTWLCASSSTYRKSDGTGWVPVALSSISYGTPLAQLPSDPVNATSSNLFYSYSTNGSQYEVTAVLESSKYKSQFATNPQIPGYPEVAAQGSNFSLSPMWNPGGLVGWWPLTEGSGTTAMDQSGNGNNGTWNGSTTNGSYYTTGKVGGYAGNFDGSTDYVSAGANGASVTSITFSGWMNESSYPSNYAPIINVFNRSTGIEQSPSTHAVFFILNLTSAGNVETSEGASSLPVSGWNFYAGTWSSGGKLSLYQNGVLISQSVSSYTDTISGLSPLWIGRYSGGTYFPGQFNDVRFYSRALSAAEIQALYNAER